MAEIKERVIIEGKVPNMSRDFFLYRVQHEELPPSTIFLRTSNDTLKIFSGPELGRYSRWDEPGEHNTAVFNPEVLGGESPILFEQIMKDVEMVIFEGGNAFRKMFANASDENQIRFTRFQGIYMPDGIDFEALWERSF